MLWIRNILSYILYIKCWIKYIKKYILRDINIEWENNKLSTILRVHSIYELTWVLVPVCGPKTLTDSLWSINYGPCNMVHFRYSMQCVHDIQVAYRIKDFKRWKKPRTSLSDNIDSRIHRIKWRIRLSIYVVPFITVFNYRLIHIYVQYNSVFFYCIFAICISTHTPSNPSSSWTYLSLSDPLFVGHAPFSTWSELNFF